MVIKKLITTFFAQLSSNPSLKFNSDPTPPDEKTPPLFFLLMGVTVFNHHLQPTQGAGAPTKSGRRPPPACTGRKAFTILVKAWSSGQAGCEHLHLRESPCALNFGWAGTAMPRPWELEANCTIGSSSLLAVSSRTGLLAP